MCHSRGNAELYLAVGSRSLGDWGGGARSPHVRWHGWRLPAVPGVQVLQGVGPGAVQAAQVDPPVTATLQRHQRQVEDRSTASGVRHKGKGVRHPSPLPRTPSLYRTDGSTCEKKVHNGCSLNRWFLLDQGVPGHGGGGAPPCERTEQEPNKKNKTFLASADNSRCPVHSNHSKRRKGPAGRSFRNRKGKGKGE